MEQRVYKKGVVSNGKLTLELPRDWEGKEVVVMVDILDLRGIQDERKYYHGRIVADVRAKLHDTTGELHDEMVIHEQLKLICNPIVTKVGKELLVEGETTKFFSALRQRNYNERCKQYLNAILGMKFLHNK